MTFALKHNKSLLIRMLIKKSYSSRKDNISPTKISDILDLISLILYFRQIKLNKKNCSQNNRKNF